MLVADSVLDAGELGVDIAAVEVWTLNPEGALIECPRGGWWINPRLAEITPSKALFRLLLDPHPEPVVPGRGIAGLLWNNRRKIRPRTFPTLPSENDVEDVMGQDMNRPPTDQCSSAAERCVSIENLLMKIKKDYETVLNRSMTWMSTNEIVNYLGTSNDDRSAIINKAGLAYVAAVPFNFCGHQGIVIYFSHNRRRKDDNEYLLRAADLIGLSSAVTSPYKSELQRKTMLNQNSRMGRLKGSLSWISKSINKLE